MTDYQTLRVTQQNAGIFIVLNRPEVHNALNEVMIAELTEAIQSCQADLGNRYILLSGEGKSFCAGADIRWMRQMASYTFEENVADARKLAELYDALYKAPLPIIVHAKGSIFGGGVGLVAAADIVIADADTIFSLSEVKLGIMPAVISPYIIRAIGERYAKRYAITGERFTASDACHIGLVHQVVQTGTALAVLEKLQDTLLLGGPMAQRETKRLFAEVSSRPMSPEIHEVTAKAIAEARASKEGKEGLQAFLEKRVPSWGAKA